MATKVGHNIEADNAGWTFGGGVPDTFVSHIRQSVPLYEEGHELVCQLSDFFVSDTSTIYEIGASTGELTKKLALHNRHKPGARWIGMDVEAAMVGKARQHCADVPNITILEEDGRLFNFEPADLIVSYYTMQFIPPRDRQALFDKIYQSLNWGGALIMFEKVRAPDARFQDIMTTLYHDFKLRNGFSPEEVLTKARSLKGVLEPFSTEGNLGLVKRAGFQDVMSICKFVSFEGFLAIK
jgi:tRNA (cmo5U34)-methyltransferase